MRKNARIDVQGGHHEDQAGPSRQDPHRRCRARRDRRRRRRRPQVLGRTRGRGSIPAARGSAPAGSRLERRRASPRCAMLQRTLQPVYLYCGAVSAAGAALCALVLANTASPLEPFGRLPVIVLTAAVIVGEVVPLTIPRRSGDGEMTVSTTFAFALLLCGGPVPALIAQLLASAIQDAWTRKPLWRILFNAGQLSLTIGAAAAAVHFVAGYGPALDTQFG